MPRMHVSVPQDVCYMCVPIGHVFVFQVSTCLFLDNARVRVCVCSGRTYIYIYIYTYVCVHVYTCVCSTCTQTCVHVYTHVSIAHVFVFQVNGCVFHVNTLVCAR